MTPASQPTFFERSWRYTVVGIFCALANNVIMIGTELLGGHYLLGVLLAVLFVAPSAYVLHSLFTFERSLSFRTFARFAAGILAGYPLTIGSMVILCSGFRFPVFVAAPLATLVLFLWNFAAAHWAILPHSRGSPVSIHVTPRDVQRRPRRE